MRRPRLRIKLFWMLLLVAVSAMIVEVEVWRRRLPFCEHNAERCRLAEKAHLRMAESHQRIVGIYREHAASAGEGARYHNEQAMLFARFEVAERTEAAKAAKRRRSFRYAARFPWLPLPAAEGETLGAGIIEREQIAEK